MAHEMIYKMTMHKLKWFKKNAYEDCDGDYWENKEASGAFHLV